jgi:hypothetical protein
MNATRSQFDVIILLRARRTHTVRCVCQQARSPLTRPTANSTESSLLLYFEKNRNEKIKIKMKWYFLFVYGMRAPAHCAAPTGGRMGANPLALDKRRCLLRPDTPRSLAHDHDR